MFISTGLETVTLSPSCSNTPAETPSKYKPAERNRMLKCAESGADVSSEGEIEPKRWLRPRDLRNRRVQLLVQVGPEAWNSPLTEPKPAASAVLSKSRKRAASCQRPADCLWKIKPGMSAENAPSRTAAHALGGWGVLLSHVCNIVHDSKAKGSRISESGHAGHGC